MPSPIQPTSTRVTVGNTPTLLANNSGRVSNAYLARNTDGALSMFVGDVNVTTSNGFEVKAGEALKFSLTDGQVIYAVSASSLVADVIVRVNQ